ncbi:MAG: RsmB/NOP family class I SAM-dependent RNA methyltransferase [Prevotellaceae bacterium]|jgi:16S rRNA C967 or C1407 C5-methylase (RsmB/RsmF family)/NOL1/NOP2/fmu family ribosome biogenesis protein|nr:RsmB/NOP family class I SAM-dependent RNA methyltransferase [Prevotellaceae bacterium]
MELPKAFIRNIGTLLGETECRRLLEALEAERTCSIRMNPVKSEGLEAIPDSSLSVVPWCTSGFSLSNRPAFTFDPLLHAGVYYVQEASSMFLEQALKQYVSSPVTMLDLCAAPGGKSTHARSLLPDGSLLVANEVNRSRAQILAENLTKWGHPDVAVTNNDPADFSRLPAFFDVILTDVPCSGEGMFRKDPVAVQEWSEANVELCRQRQRRIVAAVWQSLKPGGLLIYSTCTYNTEENEENVRWIRDELGADVLSLDVPAEWHVTGNLLAGESFPVYRFLPHKTKGEGFFLAVLQKAGDMEKEELKGVNGGKEKKKKNVGGGGRPGASLSQIASDWLLAPDEYELEQINDRLIALPRCHLSALAAIRRSLRVVQAGVAVGEQKGRDLIPAHALAMSRILRRDAFAQAALTYEQAIAYLRREAIVLPAETPRGYVLLTYQDVPLGFVKHIGNRANNLYPPEWRIRSQA